MANSIDKALDKSGVQKFWDKIKNFFVTKKEVFGSEDNRSGSDYNAGLVPSASSRYTSDMFLKSDGTWRKPQYEIGKVDLSSSGQKTIACGFRPTTFIMKNTDGTIYYAYQDGTSFVTTFISNFTVSDTGVTFRANSTISGVIIWEAYGEKLPSDAHIGG